MGKINFDKMPCKYWSDSTKISYLQRRVIIYSIMYYEYNESCISDQCYDEISQQLVNFQASASKEDLKASTYYYAMKNFDGSTGYDIISKLNKNDKDYLSNLAFVILQSWRRNQNN